MSQSPIIPVSLEAVGESVMAVCGEAFEELRRLRLENAELKRQLADRDEDDRLG